MNTVSSDWQIMADGCNDSSPQERQAERNAIDEEKDIGVIIARVVRSCFTNCTEKFARKYAPSVYEQVYDTVREGGHSIEQIWILTTQIIQQHMIAEELSKKGESTALKQPA